MEIDQLPPATQKKVLRFKRGLGLYFRRIKKDAITKAMRAAKEKSSKEKDSNHVAALPVHER